MGDLSEQISDAVSICRLPRNPGVDREGRPGILANGPLAQAVRNLKILFIVARGIGARAGRAGSFVPVVKFFSGMVAASPSHGRSPRSGTAVSTARSATTGAWARLRNVPLPASTFLEGDPEPGAVHEHERRIQIRSGGDRLDIARIGRRSLHVVGDDQSAGTDVR